MLIAIDIAVLPPLDLAQRAIALSATLPSSESQGLQLGADFLPHITLTQHFVPAIMLDAMLVEIERVLGRHAPLALRVTGGGRESSAVWMAIERAPALVHLHEELQHATERFEQQRGESSAFAGGDARERDLRWVGEFRRQSSFDRFTPHITLGHAAQPPFIEPIDFVATRVAVCHLGRFCSCRRIVREWELRRGWERRRV